MHHQTSLSLIAELDVRLLALLKNLLPDQWQAPTIAPLWKVKDIVAHLLDGNIRSLSILRDRYEGETAEIKSYEDLLGFLNHLNADWVKAFQRVSPSMLILLHEVTGPLYREHLATLLPYSPALFPVAWAGENESLNWMHIAREYTEKFIHQQQIREAVGDQSLINPEFFPHFAYVCLHALPHTLRNVPAKEEDALQWTIPGAAGGSWHVVRYTDQWHLVPGPAADPVAEIHTEAGDFWKLVSQRRPANDLQKRIVLSGAPALTAQALKMVSFMV